MSEKKKKDMVKIFTRTQSSKIGLSGIYFQTKLTCSNISKQKAWEGTNISHFGICNTFFECCNPRFLNNTEIVLQKQNHQDVLHTLPTV